MNLLQIFVVVNYLLTVLFGFVFFKSDSLRV